MKIAKFISARMRNSGSGGEVSGLSSRIAVFSVAVSIAVMIVALAVSLGFKHGIYEKTSGFVGELFLMPPGIGIYENQYPVDRNFSYIDEIASSGHVSSISPFVYATGILQKDTEVDALLFKGADSTYSTTFFSSVLDEGVLPTFKGNRACDSIVISRSLARKKGIATGDFMTVSFIANSVRVRKFFVSGIYDAGFGELEDRMVLADMRILQRVMGWDENKINGYEIFLDNPDNEGIVSVEIERILYEAPDDEDSMALGSVRDVFPQIYDWLGLLDLNLVVLLVLMTAVSGFNMVSALLILLFERIPMIGTLKAMGMKNSVVAEIFMRNSSVLILKGMFIGNLVGLVLLFVQKEFSVIGLDPASYFVDTVPVHLPVVWWAVLNVSAFIFILVILLLPSLFISGVRPEMTMRMK